MAKKGVDGSTGREANSWGAAEREAGERRGESREVLSGFILSAGWGPPFSWL